MKPTFLVFLGGALLISATGAQFARAQTVPRTGQPAVAPPLRTKAVSLATANLPLNNVVLFSSGVGYFGRSGSVDGDATVDLLVRAPQLSDILKSLVLFDPKGHVDPVTYSIQDYIGSRATSTDLNIDPASSPGAILRLLQGAQVRIERPAGPIEGRVVSVSTQQIKDGDTLRTIESATLLTATGLTTIRLDDVSSFTPLDRGLADKFAASLEKRANTLTQGLDDGVRPVTLHFRGNGRREVRAGYLLETPAWKTSYRLVIDPTSKTKPYLQGWAIVENPGDEDWQNVNLSLVSGRPISFIQDLATPVYIVRPLVQPQIIGSPTPQTFGPGYGEQADTGLRGPNATLGRQGTKIAQGLLYDNDLSSIDQLRANAPGSRFPNGGGSNAGPSNVPILGDIPMLRDAASKTNAQNQVDAQATGAERGNLFVYAIDTKVSVPHGQAAMVPILSEDVEGEPISIVPSQNTIGPLTAQNGFRLRNRSDLNLQGGPITVYSDGIYGGDAQIGNVSPGEARFIAYAVDLDLVSRLESDDDDGELLSIRPTPGALELTYRQTRVQKYAFRNKSKTDKVVILQQPTESEWKLVDAKQLFEKSNDGLRFRVVVPANKTVNYTLNWQKPEVQVLSLNDLNLGQIGVYAKSPKVAPALKAQLLAIIALKKKLNDISAQRAAQEKSLAAITQDQNRIRENLKALDKTSPLYKTYEAKLATQENQIDKIQAERDRLRAAETAANQAVADAIAALGATK